ncbi:hotdog fold thioesterase [Fluviicola taffensis]|uniref:PaaI family thioesterase n=1 Tax=Fluviicola taffensis TaxID=191579 RepID=UPI003137D39D
MKEPQDIVNEMMSKDAFSQWLGIQILEVGPGYCRLSMTVRPEMVNGHQTAHGGISYSISDSALAFAANSRGQKAVSIETSIAHISPVSVNDELLVICKEINCGKTIGRYESIVYNQNQKIIARFNGTVFRYPDLW